MPWACPKHTSKVLVEGLGFVNGHNIGTLYGRKREPEGEGEKHAHTHTPMMPLKKNTLNKK